MANKPIVLQTYKKDSAYSYTSGAYATIEMLKTRPQIVSAVYLHSQYYDKDGLTALCHHHQIPVLCGDKYFARVNQKENTYVMGIFEKYTQTLSPSHSHLLLVNPSDMGNIGTILRTAVGLGLTEVGIVLPAGDVFHPKTIRASMGALFHIRVQCFNHFTDYHTTYPNHQCYPFMLEGAVSLCTVRKPAKSPFTLIFGNEATGLDSSFAQYGISVRIPQTVHVDSLNVAIAVGIGIFTFMQDSS